MTKSIRTILAGLVAAMSLVPAATALAASGSGAGGDVRVVGTCTAASSVKLKLKLDNGRIEVDGEVDQNRNGVTWSWSITRAGATLASGTATTAAPSGSFGVRRIVSNAAGLDTITFSAARAGESCSATATI